MGLRFRLRAAEQAAYPSLAVFLEFILETMFSSNCTKVPYGLVAALAQGNLTEPRFCSSRGV